MQINYIRRHIKSILPLQPVLPFDLSGGICTKMKQGKKDSSDLTSFLSLYKFFVISCQIKQTAGENSF